MSTHIIHITGASGSGTTTLGKAISEKFDYAHLDTDTFYWEKTNPPFVKKRGIPLRQTLLGDALDSSEKCVVSGSLMDWGDCFISRFDLIIYLFAPTSIRINRLKERELAQFGNRILLGGDMHQDHLAFLEYAAAYTTGGPEIRSAFAHQKWLEKAPCPIIRLDGTLSQEAMFSLLFP